MILFDDDSTDDNSTDDDSTPVVSGTDELTVSLSPDTLISTTVPGSVNGLSVAKFDFTAGSEDVTITNITIKRRGLSDEDTIDSIAVFTDLGRASNEKDDNQENDTEAQISLTDGWVVVKAGETRTLSIVVDLNSVTGTANDEFALELFKVSASSTVEGLGNLVANSIKIGSVDAPTIIFTKWSSVSNPTLGEENVDIFEFEIDGDNDEDVILKSITFEWSSDAEDDLANFKLYQDNKLVAETTSINDDYLTFNLGDWITIEEDKNEDFTVKADIIEGANDTISFTIDEKLDVNAVSTKFGHGSSVNISSFNTSPRSITIEAGELTIVEIEPDFNEIREDKDNVVLGWFKLTNIAGQNLELQEFGVKVDLTPGSATVNWTGLTAGTLFDDFELYNKETGSSYELTIWGTSDDIFSEDSIDVIIPKWLSNWSIRADTTEDIVAFDTASFVMSFVTGRDSILTEWAFYVEETEDDEEVTDITPSSITFNTIDGSESSATVSEVNLSDVTVVRGAKDIIALQFNIEADESSYITIDEVVASINTTATAATSPTATITVNGTTLTGSEDPDVANVDVDWVGIAVDIAAAASNTAIATAIADAIDDNELFRANAVSNVVTITHTNTGTSENGSEIDTEALKDAINAADASDDDTVLSATIFSGWRPAVTLFSSSNLPNQSISEVKLYVWSVSESNLLDKESGSNIASNGTITFNDFDDEKIDANATKTFIIVVSIVDWINAVNNRFLIANLVSLGVEDDDSDDVTAIGLPIESNRQITIAWFWIITLTEDSENEDNKDNKTVLAGDSATIFSIDVRSINESIDIEEVIFTVNTDLRTKIDDASLYLDDKLINTNNIWDITATTITFDDLTNLIVLKGKTSELKLVLNTDNIGYEEDGSTTIGINVTNVALRDTEGIDSGKDASNQSIPITTSSRNTSIVPTVLDVKKWTNSSWFSISLLI